MSRRAILALRACLSCAFYHHLREGRRPTGSPVGRKIVIMLAHLTRIHRQARSARWRLSQAARYGEAI